MNKNFTFKYISIFHFISILLLQASPTYANKLEKINISQEIQSRICSSFWGGKASFAREYGLKHFGTLDSYYENIHKIECGLHPTPIYHYFDSSYILSTESEDKAEFDLLISDLQKLDLATTTKILNKPRKGRRKETTLDIFDRKIGNVAWSGADKNAKRLLAKRSLLVKLGAKKYQNLTQTEINSY